ncbi:hypothetical protein C8R43DRAFT_1244402 [Mycena crocata]|nr:hypothetical protein C8R43DRAFT_1244402 [Mycena crocata]
MSLTATTTKLDYKVRPSSVGLGPHLHQPVSASSNTVGGFPAEWLQTQDGTDNNSVIEMVHWNQTTPPPGNRHTDVSADWNHAENGFPYLRELDPKGSFFGLRIRHVFNLKGRVIPIGWIKGTSALVFTMTGPCGDGGKIFYLTPYNADPGTEHLWKYRQPFTSINDYFSRYRTTAKEDIMPQGNRRDVTSKMTELYRQMGILVGPVCDEVASDEEDPATGV